MTTIGTAASSGRPTPPEGLLVRTAIGFTAWAERWFPDAFIFVAIAVVVVALAALINGASPVAVSVAFGNGFWSLITFTMQMAFVAIGG
jgi:short-chain fatty acids transporter